MANFLTIFHATVFLLAGLFIFFFPQEFYSFLGPYYGTINIHFVKDAGIAFFCSGAMLGASMRYTQWQVPLTLCATLFIGFHGLFHLQMIVNGMIPNAYIHKEILANVLPAILLITLSFLRILKSKPH
jgi:hypothetical protein